ncbi:hypothetical protein UA08_09142 [Talaromyces atroroseus]|uniref:Uncharacterized protein n=1 Tax=Talaromyces atroroseus TaxID=1441469 RepID=A0A1Q5Q711_TALAT|nr:hypothetical protein UA08_09142 [Talaromyces atroroseus]OKL55563.1 hypothetical protein UA08_09142 [Talaromyces atroroseus]
MSDEDAVKFKLYRYDPSAGAAAVFCAVFLMTSMIHAYQLARTRTWFFIPFVLGGFFEFFGYMGVSSIWKL